MLNGVRETCHLARIGVTTLKSSCPQEQQKVFLLPTAVRSSCRVTVTLQGSEFEQSQHSRVGSFAELSWRFGEIVDLLHTVITRHTWQQYVRACLKCHLYSSIKQSRVSLPPLRAA